MTSMIFICALLEASRRGALAVVWVSYNGIWACCIHRQVADEFRLCLLSIFVHFTSLLENLAVRPGFSLPITVAEHY